MENENGGESKKQRQKHPETKKQLGKTKTFYHSEHDKAFKIFKNSR